MPVPVVANTDLFQHGEHLGAQELFECELVVTELGSQTYEYHLWRSLGRVWLIVICAIQDQGLVGPDEVSNIKS